MISKEIGSDFHLVTDPQWTGGVSSSLVFNKENFKLFLTGRSALYAILSHGIHNLGWKKVYIPSFYCNEVVDYLTDLNIRIERYSLNPIAMNYSRLDISDNDSNVIINVNYFGNLKLNLGDYVKTTVIEDVTHSILSFEQSQADYCFASLRKELPMPVGGFVYSRKLFDLAEAKLSEEAENVFWSKATAMYLKKLYLEKGKQTKDFYRDLFSSSEKALGEVKASQALPSGAIEIFNSLNVLDIIAAKQNNMKYFLENAPSNELFKIIGANSSNYFGLYLLLQNKYLKLSLKNYLIKNSIFPATLWPDQTEKNDQDIADRSLFVHLDFRYSFEDMDYLIITLENFKDDV